MAVVHSPSYLLVPFSALYRYQHLRYKQFCWCTPSFIVDFSLIYDNLFNIHTPTIVDVYIAVYMVIEHCSSNHLIPNIAL